MNSEIFRFWSDHLAIEQSSVKGDEIRTTCPFHSDESPSFSANSESGLWKCFNPSCEGYMGGNLYSFYQLIHKTDGISFEDAKEAVLGEYEIVQPSSEAEEEEPEPEKVLKDTKQTKDFPISNERIEAAHQELLKNEKVLNILKKEFLWTEETVKANKLGFDPVTMRIWIPIIEKNKVVNIRKYSRKGTVKVMSEAGWGQARLWPLDALEQDTIYLFEGEKDRILASQLGLNSVTVTSGAGTFDSKWVPLFRGKTVVICYDIDKAGQDGAKRVAKLLQNIAKSVKMIHLPIVEPENADFTDFILAGHTIQDFHAIVDGTETMKAKETREISDAVITMHTEEAILNEKFCTRVKTRGRIISTRLPAIIPKSLKFSCLRDLKSTCVFCPHMGSGEAELELDERTEVLLRYLSSGIKEDKAIHKAAFEPMCDFKHWTVTESVGQRSVMEVYVAPIVDDVNVTDNICQRFEEYKMYVIDKRLDVNTDYDIELVIYKHPIDREVTCIIYKAEPCQSSLHNFKLTKEQIEQLKEFQVEEDKEETRQDVRGSV